MPDASAGTGTSSTAVSAQIGGLAPNTRYHVRLVAANAGGVKNGVDRSFVTDRAPAAPAPGVSTQGARSVTQTSAVLTGTVDPNGTATSYVFQYGPTKAYGATTAAGSAGAGGSGVAVSVPVTGLTPNTTYHYRLVATGATVVSGADRSFATSKVPNAASLGAIPNPAHFGGTTMLVGQLTGSAVGGVRVTLQADAFPFSAGFRQLGNPQVTGGSGRYAFTVSPLLLASRFRVVAATRPPVVSPVVTVGVRVSVSLHVSTAHPQRGHRVRFAGSVRPAHAGAVVSIQRKSASGRYETVARTQAVAKSATRSVYARRITVRRDGRYRVLARPQDADHSSGRSTPREIHVR